MLFLVDMLTVVHLKYYIFLSLFWLLIVYHKQFTFTDILNLNLIYLVENSINLDLHEFLIFIYRIQISLHIKCLKNHSSFVKLMKTQTYKVVPGACLFYNGGN